MIANICKQFIARYQNINVCHLYETYKRAKSRVAFVVQNTWRCMLHHMHIHHIYNLIWLRCLLWGLYKWREEIITYECTSCSLSIKTWPPLGLVATHLTWLGLDKFGVFKANFRAESTRNNNIWVAYYYITICWMNGGYTHMQ